MPGWKRSLLGVSLAAVLAVGFLAGAAYRQFRPYSDRPPPPPQRTEPDSSGRAAAEEGGRFGAPAADHRSETMLPDEQAEEVRRLQAIGYASGSAPAVDTVNVTRHDPGRAYRGLNLYTDGHAPEATLMDMDGNVLHRWSLPFRSAFPDSETPDEVDGVGYWRRVALAENGELLGIHEGQGLVKLDAASNLLWVYPGLAHHDLEIRPDGTIYVLTRVAEIVPRISPTQPVLHDFITVLDPDGRERESVSVLEAIERSEYLSLVGMLADSGDILHTNTLEVLDGRLADRLPAFRSGNVLISSPMINTIGVIDMAARKMVWALSGLSIYQHDPTVLDNGHMLLFDNRGDRGSSRVIEFDPVTQEVHWAYRGSESGFYSECCGTNQRLPNGNTLITETNHGRAFEVTPAGDIVWEFFTPNRVGENLEYIVALFEVLRLPPDYPVDWATGSDDPRGDAIRP